MLTEEQGIKAIIELQKAGGVTESEEDAKKGWNAMSDSDKRSTEDAHKVFCGGFDSITIH